MSEPTDGGESRRRFDDILTDLERTIGVLADGSAPLEQLVDAHQKATRLLAEARSRLSELKAHADETAQLLAD
jgi:ABC-type transporter Mla subunit MlaD